MTARVPSLSSLILQRSPAGPSEPGTVLDALRLEQEHAEGDAARARLLHALASLHDHRGELPQAAHDYLQATNLAPTNLAPLQGLIGIALRRDSRKNLEPLLERLAQLARTPGELQQAFLLLSESKRRAHGEESALSVAHQWLEQLPNDATAWLVLDALAARSGDRAQQERARLGRAAAAHDAQWRALLLLDCARLRADSGDVDSALDLCRQAYDEFPSLFVLRAWERCALAGERWSDASALAERVADLIETACGDNDAARSADVPSWQLNEAQAHLSLLRAAEWARRAGDRERTLELLSRCREGASPEVLLRLADLLAHEPERSDVYCQRLEAEAQSLLPDNGRLAAALWLERAEVARRENDVTQFRRAITEARAADPQSLVTGAFELDLLEERSPAEYAAALAAWAPRWGSGGGNAALAAALFAATSESRAGADSLGLMEAARSQGADRLFAARLGAALGHLTRHGELRSTSLEELARHGSPEERLDAALAMIRCAVLEQGVPRAQSEALDAPSPPPDEIARALSLLSVGNDARLLPATFRTLLLPLWTHERSPEESAAWKLALAEADASPSLLRAADLLTCSRFLDAGQTQPAIDTLRSILRSNPSERVAASALADLLSREDPGAAADVLALSARHQDDPELRAAWLLRAARLNWECGQPGRALPLIREAESVAPEAARPWVLWAKRLQTPDDLRERAEQLLRTDDARGHFPVLEGMTLALRQSLPELEAQLATTELTSESRIWLEALRAASAAQSIDELPLTELDALSDVPLGSRETIAYGVASRSDLPSDSVLEHAKAWAQRATQGREGVDGALAWLVASRKAQRFDDEVAAKRLLSERLNAPELEAAAALTTLSTSVETQPTPYDAEWARQDASTAWAALELSPPGSDANGRADVLEHLAERKHALPAESGGDASSVGTFLALSGFNRLASGQTDAAARSFRRVTELLPEDPMGWEGLRAVAVRLADFRLEAEASIELAKRTYESAAAAALWERAGVIHQDLLEDVGAAEEAFAAALSLDFRRERAFQRLFLIVRGRGDQERLLELVDGRLSVVEEPRQIEELLWEKARLTRQLGDERGAIAALGLLLDRQPGHLGALALMSELCLRQKLYAQAARCLSQLASHEGAPERQRLVAGIAAADIYEQRLERPETCVSVLQMLQGAGLGDASLSERLGITALRIGLWSVAASSFEQVLEQTSPPEARSTAAAFLLALYRDQLPEPDRALRAARTLLEDRPSDRDALVFLMERLEADERRPLVLRALQDLRSSLRERLVAEEVRLVALLAQDLGWSHSLERAHELSLLLDRGATAEQAAVEFSRLDEALAQEEP